MGISIYTVLGCSGEPSQTIMDDYDVRIVHSNEEGDRVSYTYFAEVPEDYSIDRSYALFSWLCGHPDKVCPLPNLKENLERTSSYIDWMDEIDSASFQELDIGDCRHIIYTLKELIEFDYDQVVLVPTQGSYVEEGESEYVLSPEGKTYRQLFPASYFNLLDYCNRCGWEFLMFGFD